MIGTIKILRKSFKKKKKKKNYEEWSEENIEKTQVNVSEKTVGEVVKEAKRDLLKKGTFSYKSWISGGTFSDVHRVVHKKKNTPLACKIELDKLFGQREMELWSMVNGHAAIMILYRVSSNLDTTTFVMPFFSKNLVSAVFKLRKRKDKSSLKRIKGWFMDVLGALEYLEFREMCHMNLSYNDVYVRNDSKAVLGGFTWINSFRKPLSRMDIGLPEILCPPEAFKTTGVGSAIDGRAVDMWAFGMLASEILTFFSLDGVKECTNWRKRVWPTMCYILEERNFGMLMRDHFKWIRLTETETKLAANFIYSFLRLDPSMRTRPAFAMNHQFLERGMDLGPSIDTMWTKHGFSFML